MLKHYGKRNNRSHSPSVFAVANKLAAMVSFTLWLSSSGVIIKRSRSHSHAPDVSVGSAL